MDNLPPLTPVEQGRLIDYCYFREVIHNEPESLRLIELGLISWRATDGEWGCWITHSGIDRLKREGLI